RTSMRVSPLVALTTLYGTSLISWSTSSWRRPMNRLIENTVFSGLVIACRLATCPTRTSPSFVKPTTEGVIRLPSWLGMTTGLPPSITATTELVVPRSMPITFAMPSSGSGMDRDATAPGACRRLREVHRQHAVDDARLGAVQVDPGRQRHGAHERPVVALRHVDVTAP